MSSRVISSVTIIKGSTVIQVGILSRVVGFIVVVNDECSGRLVLLFGLYFAAITLLSE